ncbi:MAG: phage virion morphogenesis protein [Gammaproteobacteria bacterium]|nr:phage virion morphogenesis protein [Gammaproteobacteria bacterium]
MKLAIEIDDRAVLQALNRLAAAADDLSPAMRDISTVLAEAAERAFETESDPATGTPWAPLTPSTQRRKVDRKGTARGSRPILQVTGQLATSIQADWGPDFAAAGTNLVYAVTHQFGAKRGAYGATGRGSPIPWGDVPARPFLGIDADDKTEIIDIIEHHLAAVLRGL